MKWLMAIFSVLLFLGTVVILALLIRQKRYRLLWLAVPMTILSYIMEQCFASNLSGLVFNEFAKRVVTRFAALSDQTLLLYCVVLAVVELAMFWNIIRYEASRITVSSVKIAMDNLATGIFCYTRGGRILLMNHAMENFCRKTVGIIPSDSEEFFTRLLTERIQSHLRTDIVGDEPVTLLSDNTAWKISTEEILYENHPISMLTVSDITEAYRKSQELSIMQQNLSELGKKLIKVNQEIIALTTEREILNAKVKIHNELGSNLLSMKHHCLNGVKPQELEEIIARLRLSITFLQSEPATVRDEYELLIEMASGLGIHIAITGTLPQGEMQKRIIVTAIHECVTNTLRHAHGDELRIRISEEGEKLFARFTNNGEQPTHEIVEGGGLMSLRAMVEKSDGKMTVCSLPIFTISLELPKEVPNAL